MGVLGVNVKASETITKEPRADMRRDLGPSAMKRSTLVAIGALVTIISFNLAWEHRPLLVQMVDLNAYYAFAERAPMVFRILPALIGHVVLGSHAGVATGLKEPFDSYGGIFQVALDTISLVLAFVFLCKIVRELNKELSLSVVLTFTGTAALMIVVFGYFQVPTKGWFYPYDFPDLCIASIIFYLCIRGGTVPEMLLPVAVFVATFNKETAVFYSGLYLIFSIERHRDWKRVVLVLFCCAAAFVLARSSVLLLTRTLGAPSSGGIQFENHILETLQQLKNPSLLIAFTAVFSYLYLPVWVIRKRLDRTDVLILGMVLLWMLVISTVGILRQFRLYVPASVLLFVILARHLSEVLAAWVPTFTRGLALSRRET
jgi:hypothetical protein